MVLLPVVYLELCQNAKMYDSDRAKDITFVKYRGHYLHFYYATFALYRSRCLYFRYIILAKYRGRYLYFCCAIVIALFLRCVEAAA